MNQNRYKLTMIALMLAFAPFAVSAQELARMAVTDFSNKVDADYGVCAAMVDMMSTALARSGKFSLVERGSIASLAEEQAFGQSGMVEASSAAEIGKVLGADYVVIGALTEINSGESQGFGLGGIRIDTRKFSMAIDVRVVDCASSELKLAETFREERGGNAFQFGGAAFSASDGAGGEMTRAIIDAIAVKVCSAVYPPTVIQSSGDAVTINYGDMMFEVGDIYDVMQLGEEIVDPATGRVLGSARTQVGTISITQVDSRMSFARLTGGSAPVGSILFARPKEEKKDTRIRRKRGRR